MRAEESREERVADHRDWWDRKEEKLDELEKKPFWDEKVREREVERGLCEKRECHPEARPAPQ